MSFPLAPLEINFLTGLIGSERLSAKTRIENPSENQERLHFRGFDAMDINIFDRWLHLRAGQYLYDLQVLQQALPNQAQE
jgi:hypothetical protein